MVSGSFTKNNHQEMNKSKKSKNTVENRWSCVEIFMFACVCVYVCVCVCVCVCFGYSCVLLCVDGKVVFSVCVCEDAYIERERERERGKERVEKTR